MITAHNDGPQILCDDGNGSIPEIVNRIAVQSQPGRLMLLPAIPDARPQGSISGTRARGQIGVVRISWDMKAGTLTAVLT
jgi:alpha-L-fucosidase 2